MCYLGACTKYYCNYVTPSLAIFFIPNTCSRITWLLTNAQYIYRGRTTRPNQLQARTTRDKRIALSSINTRLIYLIFQLQMPFFFFNFHFWGWRYINHQNQLMKLLYLDMNTTIVVSNLPQSDYPPQSDRSTKLQVYRPAAD